MRWLESNDLGLVLVAFIGAIASILGGGKLKSATKGEKPADQGAQYAEIKGAIVSDKAVQKMVGSMDALSEAIHTDVKAKQTLTEALDKNSKALDRNSDVADHMQDHIKDTATHIDRLREEIFRGSITERTFIQRRD